jgi:dTDP-4-dehydrorhamnose reductase
MKVMITGASGILGSSCVAVFSTMGHNVQALSHKKLRNMSSFKIAELLSSVDLVIHAAANTNVEQCEIDPDSCYRDNLILTEIVATACSISDIRLVYISSTGVYGDYQNTAYREYSKTSPTTHHHASKLLGEKAVLAASADNLIVRVGWLFGGTINSPKNFVSRRLEEAKELALSGKVLHSNNEQQGCPTYTVDVANRILLLVNSGHRGLFNVVNEDQASRFEYVQAIIEMGGISVDMEPANSLFFNRKAKVSFNEAAINWRSNQIGLPNMPNWRASLELYVSKNLKALSGNFNKE